MADKTKALLIKEEASVKNAMKQMDKNGEKILFVVNGHGQLLGSLTDGDIRRWILSNGDLRESIIRIYNKNSRFVKDGSSLEDVKGLMLAKKLTSVPAIDKSGHITKVYLWEHIFSNRQMKPNTRLRIPVVIMAGGKGKRLDPFTKILPKPLIPIGEEPVIKIIMDRFSCYGIRRFFISLNHKQRMIKAYFDEMNTGYDIHYLVETEVLGTAGALKNLSNRINGPMLVTNCDIIIESDYGEILKFHNERKYDITIVGSFRHYKIPYGICEIEEKGRLKYIKEKPEYDFLINTGMYIIERRVLDLIPRNRTFHMTSLIKKAQDRSMKVGVFPLTEKSWIDVGEWEEYRKAVEELGNRK